MYGGSDRRCFHISAHIDDIGAGRGVLAVRPVERGVRMEAIRKRKKMKAEARTMKVVQQVGMRRVMMRRVQCVSCPGSASFGPDPFRFAHWL